MKAVNASQLLRDPVGHFVAGRSAIVWVQSPSRIGAVHRSPLDVEDAPTLAMLAPLPMAPSLVAPIDMLHDLSGVTALDERAFVWAHGFIAQWIEQLAARARRIAVVRPSGMAGAVLTGLFHDWVQPRCNAKLCAERSEAHDWLAIDAAERAEIDELHDSLTQPALIRRMREALAADLQDATVERIAAALAISTRSLQRQLSACGTSFSDEISRARIRAAEVMVLESDEKIETIAAAVGFRSGSAFSAMFRRVNSESPVTFRQRARNRTTSRDI